MELPHLGKHCSQSDCNKLDFLPIKCDVCLKIFCGDHYSYTKHNCDNAYRKDNQVPVCPLCNKPIPIGKGQIPDQIVGNHIDNDCQSDPAINKRKVFTNRCTLKGCKIKEVIPVVCTECGLNYCLKHRHPQDHQCVGKTGVTRNRALNAAMMRQKQTVNSNQIQGQMSEDEALARALALSMDEGNPSNFSQEELDAILAKQLQESEYRTTGQRETTNHRSNNDRCIVI